MTSIYESWVDEEDAVHARVHTRNGVLLGRIPAAHCGMTVDGAYVAYPVNTVDGAAYGVAWCAARQTGNFEWLRHCCTGLGIHTSLDAAKAAVDADIARCRARAAA